MIEPSGGQATYPGPKCKLHGHEPPDQVRDQHITSANADSLFIEWVYIIDPKELAYPLLNGRP